MNDEHRRSRPEGAAFGASGDASLEARIGRTRAVPPDGLRGRVLGEVGRCLADGPRTFGGQGAESWSSDGIGGLLVAIGTTAITLSLFLAGPLPRARAGIASLRSSRPLLHSLLEEPSVNRAGPPAAARPDDGSAPPARGRPPSAGLHLSTADVFSGEL